MPAAGQPVADHLKCYKLKKDPQQKASYTADLGGLVAEPGCTIKVPATMVCVPATKTNVVPQPQGTGGTGSPNAFGCYKIRCPKATLPTIPLSDQFGSRSVIPSAPKLLCAPAPPPSTTTTITRTTTTSCPPATAPYCGGSSGCGGVPAACGAGFFGLCPQGMTCTSTGPDLFDCACTGAEIRCGDPRLSGLTCNFCKWGTCPSGMTCGGVPKTDGCGYDCACQ